MNLLLSKYDEINKVSFYTV